MFDSGITAKKLIETIKSETDIAIDIPIKSYIDWLNALEQVLYREVIKEQSKLIVSFSKKIDVEAHGIRFEDIHAVYAGDIQLIKSTLASGVIFPDTYYKDNNELGINITGESPDTISVIHFVRPELKTEDNWSELNLMLPIEFIDIAKAKLRGEAYKLANEDALAAKWLNDYNVLLETFKVWISEKAPVFGM